MPEAGQESPLYPASKFSSTNQGDFHKFSRSNGGILLGKRVNEIAETKRRPLILCCILTTPPKLTHLSRISSSRNSRLANSCYTHSCFTLLFNRREFQPSGHEHEVAMNTKPLENHAPCPAPTDPLYGPPGHFFGRGDGTSRLRGARRIILSPSPKVGIIFLPRTLPRIPSRKMEVLQKVCGKVGGKGGKLPFLGHALI